MPAPLDFGKLPPKPAKTEGAVKPLDFGAAPIPQRKPEVVMTGYDPFDFRSPVPPPGPAPTAAPKRLDFGAVSPPKSQPVTVSAAPKAAFVDKTDMHVPDVLRIAEQSFPEVFKALKDKLEIQIKQLLPLTINTVLSWGDKPLGHMATQNAAVTTLIREVSQSRANDLISEVMKALNEGPSFLQRLKGGDPVSVLKPRLAVVQANINQWLIALDQLSIDTKRTETQMSTVLASFASVAMYLGTNPDTQLELATSQRRGMLQQALMQTQLLVQQVVEQQKQLYTLKTTLDQLFNVTLPAYENAKATR